MDDDALVLLVVLLYCRKTADSYGCFAAASCLTSDDCEPGSDSTYLVSSNSAWLYASLVGLVLQSLLTFSNCHLKTDSTLTTFEPSCGH